MSALKHFKSPELPLFGPAHGVVIAPGSSTVILAGQVGTVDKEGTMAGTFLEQVSATFKNVETALAAAGATPKDIVHLRYFITDAQAAENRDLDGFRKIRADWLAKFPGAAPAGTLLGVSELVTPEIMFEVDTIAAISPQSKL